MTYNAINVYCRELAPGAVSLSTALAKHHANGDTSMVTEIVNLCPIM